MKVAVHHFPGHAAWMVHEVAADLVMPDAEAQRLRVHALARARVWRPPDTPVEQAGIMFGPDQDNYVKLVAAAQPNGSFIQFIDEQTSGTTYNHALAGSNVASGALRLGAVGALSGAAGDGRTRHQRLAQHAA